MKQMPRMVVVVVAASLALVACKKDEQPASTGKPVETAGDPPAKPAPRDEAKPAPVDEVKPPAAAPPSDADTLAVTRKFLEAIGADKTDVVASLMTDDVLIVNDNDSVY